MEMIDKKLEWAVWQRVQGGEKMESMQPLAAAEQGAAAMYLQLARMYQGREKELLRQLHHRERGHLRRLNGLNILLTGQPLSVRTVPPEVSRPAVALSRCYAATLRAAAEYEKRAAAGEHGQVFHRLAAEEWENAAMVLEILGSF